MLQKCERGHMATEICGEVGGKMAAFENRRQRSRLGKSGPTTSNALDGDGHVTSKVARKHSQALIATACNSRRQTYGAKLRHTAAGPDSDS